MATIRVLAVLVALSWSVDALAQDPPPPTHEQTFEAAFVGVTGNASSTTFGLGADVVSRPDSWLIRNKVAFVRNESNDVLVANAFDFTSRAQHTLTPRVSMFGEYGFFRDRFAGVSSRNTGTGGVAVKVLDSDGQVLNLEAGLGYVNESRLTGEDISSASYMAATGYRLAITETSELVDDLRLSGIFAESGNWRLEHTIGLTTRIAAGLSLKVSHAVRYAHSPPPGFRKTDAIMSVALVARFAQP